MKEERPSPLLRVKFLNVGQGDAIVAILPNSRRAILVDVYDFLRVRKTLEDEGIDQVLLFLSHSDKDHVKGVRNFLGAFDGSIHAFIFNQDRLVAKVRCEHTRLMRCLATAASKARARGLEPLSSEFNTNLNSNTKFKALVPDLVKLEVLHPEHSEQTGLIGVDTNEVSGVLRISYASRRGSLRTVLLTGDIQLTGISCMMDRLTRQRISLRADVLKYPHHGAWPSRYPGVSQFPYIKRRSMQDFLEAVNPEVIVLSVGFVNKKNHVRKEVFTAFARLLDGKRLRVERVMCTQLTRRCLRDGDPPKSRECAGDVEIRLGPTIANGIEVLPSPHEHERRILSVSDCRNAGCARVHRLDRAKVSKS
jgi:beta-lactamase superfamily II metal-dependent hydrolase